MKVIYFTSLSMLIQFISINPSQTSYSILGGVTVCVYMPACVHRCVPCWFSSIFLFSSKVHLGLCRKLLQRFLLESAGLDVQQVQVHEELLDFKGFLFALCFSDTGDVRKAEKESSSFLFFSIATGSWLKPI